MVMVLVSSQNIVGSDVVFVLCLVFMPQAYGWI